MATQGEVVSSIKGLDSKFQCRGFQFEVGQTYSVSGRIKACENGFHACPDHPFDVWEYYPPGSVDGSVTRYALVEQSGKTDRDGNKIASASITFKAEISLPDFIKRGVEYILAQVDWKNAKESNTGYRSAATNTGDQSAATNTGAQSAATNTGYQSAATNSGDRSAATNTGYQSAATNTGAQSAATNTGYQSAATNTGYQSAATNTGYQSAATNTGYRSAATNTGYQSAATNSGDRSAATNTGYQSAATNTGDRSAATNSGDRSAATNTGDRSAATNTGDRSAATVEGKHSVAIACGVEGRARAGETGAIVLVYRDPDDGCAIKHIFAAKVGERGVKADTFYRLDEKGNPQECE